jgi:PAS domain S-box-containing protein
MNADTDFFEHLKKLSLLYVEDDDNTREELEFFLKNKVKKLYLAKNGQEGFDFFKKYKPDLIITDIQMPIMTGTKMIKLIKEINQTIPIVIVTAFNDTEYLFDAIKLNITNYLTKPLNLFSLSEILSNIAKNINLENENKEIYNKLKQYKSIVDEKTIIIKTDTQRIITYVNEAFEKIFGYKKDELIGKPFSFFKQSNLTLNEESQKLDNIFAQNIWKGNISTFKKDEQIIYCDLTMYPLKGDDNNIIEYMGIYHDITQIVELHAELDDTQREIIYKLGEIGESRSSETGQHVRRVAEYSKLLALKIGLNQKDVNMLFMASPMHDIGKIGIPDSILNKNGKLDSSEWEVMKNHAQIGYDILKTSKREILQAAGIVSYTHHEKWDGSGYPLGLKGQEIHIFGRITSIADVFDALCSERVYKKAWPLEKVLELLIEEKEKHFDPKLIDIFMDNLDEILEIQQKYKDVD